MGGKAVPAARIRKAQISCAEQFAVRQERVLGQGVRCWNSTTSSAPEAEMADDFGLSCGMSTWWQLVASHMHLHRLPASERCPGECFLRLKARSHWLHVSL